MNDHLRADLASGADTFDLPPGDVGAVVQRARRRNRRRHQLTASVAALAIVATTVAAIRVANPDDPATLATEGSAARLGDSGIEWQRIDADPASSLAYAYSPAVEVGGTSYAVSTAPGRAAADQVAPRALWRSTDGVAWEQAAMPAFSPGHLAAGDGRLYAIGTSPATSGTTVQVGWSTGGSGAWQDQTLPVDTSALQAISKSPVQVVPRDVAATADSVVGVVEVSVDLDIAKVLPGEATPNGWYLGPDGIDVLGDGPECPAGTTASNPAADAKRAAAGDPVASKVDGFNYAGLRRYESYCFAADGTGRSYVPTETFGVAAHHPFADLAISGDALRAVQRQPFVFRADATGGPFERVDVGDLSGPAEIEAADGGFVLALTSASKPLPPTESTQPVLLRSTDGKVWRADRGLPSFNMVQAMGMVDGHLAIIGAEREGSVFTQLVDGAWRTTQLSSLVDGRKGGWIGNAAIGPLGVVAAATQSKGDSSETVLLASRDGQTWSRTSVDALIGDDGSASQGSSVTQVVIKDDRAVASISIYRKGQKPTQVALVGTPR